MDLATLKELRGHSLISITMSNVRPALKHKPEVMDKREIFNIVQRFAMRENFSGPPPKVPAMRIEESISFLYVVESADRRDG